MPQRARPLKQIVERALFGVLFHVGSGAWRQYGRIHPLIVLESAGTGHYTGVRPMPKEVQESDESGF